MKKTHRYILLLIVVALLLVQLFSFLNLRSRIREQIDDHIVRLYEQHHPMNKITVYTTTYGEKYHAGDCRYLAKSKHLTTLRRAVLAGYAACSVCSTPQYIATYNGIDTYEEYVEAGYLDILLEEYQIRFTVLFTVIPIIIAVLIILLVLSILHARWRTQILSVRKALLQNISLTSQKSDIWIVLLAVVVNILWIFFFLWLSTLH